MSIRKKLFSTKIGTVQLDPFGLCNAKCWFCPVKYMPQPEVGAQVMSIELLEKIFAEIDNEKKKPDGLIHPAMNFITTAHYNEILLYKHFEDLLKILRKYRFTTFVLTNGLPLNKEKTDLIKEYRDVVTQVGLNIPAFEKELWAERSGVSSDQFDILMNNLKYADQQLTPIRYNIQIHVNGIDANSLGGSSEKGPGFDDLKINLDPKIGEHHTQYLKAKQLFPRWNVTRSDLFDRAGSISIISNEKFLKDKNENKTFVGCENWRGDRSTQWLHINSAAQTFLCVNDYHFDYVFGDLTKQTLSEIWGSDTHINVLNKAFGEICTKCVYATFK